MKKLIASLLMLSLLVGGLTYGTIAYFSDTEVSENNTFTTGTIDIAVDGENPWTTEGTFSIADMKPSSVFYREVTVENAGNNPVNLWKKVTVLSYDGGDNPESEQEEEERDGVDNTIGAVIRYDMSLDGEEVISESDGYVMDEGEHQLEQTTSINGQYMYLGRLEPEQSMIVRQSYHMDSSTTNWAQGDIMNLSVEFYAQQTSGGAPAPTPELPEFALGVLDYLDVANNDTPDMLVHDTQGWMDDPMAGGYGARDGETMGDIAMVWGEDGVCDASNNNATFMMNSGAVTATSLTLRHLDGMGDDAFDVYVDGVLVGSYSDAYSSETWVSTTFPVSFTGSAMIEIVATAPAWTHCNTWGQVAFNWAELR